VAVTFDGPNLRIILEAGVDLVDVEVDLFSEWKVWFKTGDNSKHAFAFGSEGGGPLTPGIDQGAYFRFRNDLGWRIRPAEEDATVNFTGNLAPSDSTLPMTAPTLGGFTVLINGLQPITQNVDTIIDEQTVKVTNLQYMIESLRDEHSAFGAVFYWNPVNGSDAADGLTPDTAFLTFAAAQAAVQVDMADVIFIVNDSGSTLTITERLSITKNGLILRGPGPEVLFEPTDDAGDTISVAADHVSLEGFSAKSTGATPRSAISVVGAGCQVKDIFIEAATDHGIEVNTGTHHVIENCTVESCGSHGIHLIDTVNIKVFGNRIQRNTGYGLALTEVGGGARDAWIARNVFHHDGSGGILNDTGVSMTIIKDDNYFGPRPGTPGGEDIVDNGTGTHNEYAERQERIAEAVQPGLNATNIARESERGHHTATGAMFFWDPVNGDDTNDGLTKGTAKITWGGVSGANSLVTANEHDLVILIPGEPAGTTVITEQIELDKEYTFLRGPGRDVHFLPDATTGVTVAISAEGCEVSGARISTAPTGDGEAIEVSGSDFAYLHDIWIEQCMGDGIRLMNVSFSKIKDAHIRNCLGNAVVFRGITQDCQWNTLSDAFIVSNVGHGILFEGVNCRNNFVWGGEDGITIMSNGGWGALEQDSADFNHVIGPIVHIHENTLGATLFIGEDSGAESIGGYATSAQVERNAHLTEYGKGHHTWSGEVFYVDPVDGDTIANGANGSRSHPLNSVQECHDSLVVDSRHDVIFLLPGGAGTTTLTEDVTLTKRYLFIRGPGRDFIWTRSGAGAAITVSADGIELTGFQLETNSIGAGAGISASGVDFLRVSDVWINETRGDGINISNSSNIVITRTTLLNSGTSGAGHGIRINPAGGASNNITIEDCDFDTVQGNAIWLMGGTVSNTHIERNTIHNATGWAVKIEAGVQGSLVLLNHWGNNTLGNLSDEGTGTIAENPELGATVLAVADGVWQRVLDGTLTMEEGGRIVLAALAGKSNATQGPDRVIYRDVGDTKNRIDAFHSPDGDRVAVTLDAT